MNVPLRKAPRSRFRYRRYGVYDLTYEDAASPSFMGCIYSLLEGFQAICKKIPYVRRQLVDTITLAPAAFVAYTMTTIWLSVYSAINLYWLSVLLETGFVDRSTAISWVFCVIINVAAERAHARSLEILTKRFRAHFIPQLIGASIRADVFSMQSLHFTFPVQGRFESEFPGGPFLMQFSQLIQCTLGLISQMAIMLHAIARKQGPERKTLLYFCIARGLVWWLAPSNGIGCSAYIYWPNNRHFQRMKALFGLAFSTQYRANLMLDGMAGSIEKEYKRSAEQLGDVEDLDPTPWRTELLREWYWDVLMEITLDLPMAIYALVHTTHLSPSSIASMVLLQQATKSISLSIGQCTEDMPSLPGVCYQAKRLYDAIDHQSAMLRGTEPFPRLMDRSDDAGMKISFRHVSLQYPGSDRHALLDVTFDILPGELVLVVGTNGSGKSTVLKLLARLFDPTAGEILVDDLPLAHYDIDQLRGAMAFQSQSPAVYPVSVKENIAFGLPLTCSIDEAHVEEAARMGGCSGWISRLCEGYDTQLQPSFDITQGWMEGMYGYPSEALKDALAQHKGHVVSISDGEKQRLAAARTFMRIIHPHRTTRLVVVDEATSALDPVAERSILTTLCNLRAGKTVIVVAHRFHHLTHAADRILCIQDGRVVGNAPHTELVRTNRDYAALYHAQPEVA